MEFSPNRIVANKPHLNYRSSKELDEISEEVDDNDSDRPTKALQQAPPNIKENGGSAGLVSGHSFPFKTLSKKNTQGVFGSYLSSISETDDVDLLTDNQELDNLMNPVIYHRGIRSEYFYLIITGHVCICSGNEGFIAEKGPFEFLGVQCLENPQYLPDFSCKILNNAKLLRVSRQDYLKAKVRDGLKI